MMGVSFLGPLDPPPPLRLIEMIKGLENGQLMYVVAKLGIADVLASGPKTAAELAEATESQVRPLYRVMRALAGAGVFREDEQGRFSLTWESACLRSGIRGSVRAFAIVSGEEWYWRLYGGLFDLVKTGKPAFEHIFGMKIYEFLEKNPEALRQFHEFMDENSRYWAPVIFHTFDFSSYHTLVELGVGRASLLLLLLEAHPTMRAVLFDAPHVLERTRPLLEAAGFTERCEFIAGDFFKAVPPGGDAYLIRNVLTDWDDQHVTVILRNCRQAMSPNATLLISEPLLEEGPAPGKVRCCDIQVMLGCDGAQRTGSEWQALLAKSGFELRKITPTGPLASMIEASPK